MNLYNVFHLLNWATEINLLFNNVLISWMWLHMQFTGLVGAHYVTMWKHGGGAIMLWWWFYSLAEMEKLIRVKMKMKVNGEKKLLEAEKV